MKFSDRQYEEVINAIKQKLECARDWKIHDEGFGHDTKDLQQQIEALEISLEIFRAGRYKFT